MWKRGWQNDREAETFLSVIHTGGRTGTDVSQDHTSGVIAGENRVIGWTLDIDEQSGKPGPVESWATETPPPLRPEKKAGY